MLHVSSNVQKYDAEGRSKQGCQGTSALNAHPCTQILARNGQTLTKAFSKGWISLPTEIKIKVLQHNLVSPTGVKFHRRCRYIDDVLVCHRHGSLDALLRHHLAMGPFIAPLAEEVYYKHNTFTLQKTHCAMLNLPPRALRPLICTLHLDLHLCSNTWRLMEQLAAGMYGFGNVRYVNIKFLWSTNAIRTLLNSGCWDQKPITFNCMGTVTFEEEAVDGDIVIDHMLQQDIDKEGVENRTKGLITFAPSSRA